MLGIQIFVAKKGYARTDAWRFGVVDDRKPWNWKGVQASRPGQQVPEKFVLGGSFALVCGSALLTTVSVFGLRLQGGGPEVGFAISLAFVALGVLAILGGVTAHRKETMNR